MELKRHEGLAWLYTESSKESDLGQKYFLVDRETQALFLNSDFKGVVPEVDVPQNQITADLYRKSIP